MRRLARLSILAAVAALAFPAAAMAEGSGGVSGPAFYVDGELYRTVGTPTDFAHTGAPDSSYQTIWDFGGVQANVADAGPGQPGFRGGRWQVRPLAFNSSYAATVAAHDTNASGNLDSNEEIESALADPGMGGATEGAVVKLFACPVIKQPAHQR